jgi:hypothetical protein
MTHFLDRLVDRARGEAPRVEPLLTPRFASSAFTEAAEEKEVAPDTRSERLSADDSPPSRAPAEPVEKTDLNNPLLVRPERVPTDPLPKTPEQPIEIVRETLLVPLQNPEPNSPLLVRQMLAQSHETGIPGAPVSPLTPATNRESKQSRDRTPTVPPNESAEERPIVRVTIGRIEVRAVTPPAPAPRQAARPPVPKLTLDDYLKSRNEGAR